MLLMKQLGLIYAAIDMAIDSEGNHVFFEVNPGGQWLFIEIATDLPISDAMADSLTDISEINI